MASPNLNSRGSIISSPILRKNSQADDVIYGEQARARSQAGSSLNPQRLFKRSTWKPSPDPRLSSVAHVQYSPAPDSIISLNNMSSSTETLSSALLEHQPYLLEVATRAPFLVAAGTGNLSKILLSMWLSQRRLYAQAYIGFIGSLISRVDLPYAYIEDKKSSIRWRIVQMLSSSLETNHKDLKFLEDVGKRHHINLEFAPRPDVYFVAAGPTKQYIDLFRAFWTNPTMTLLEGFVILWATKHCQLTAWKFASRHLNPTRGADLDGGALRKEFIPRWTSNESEKFVSEVTECMNLLADREDAGFKIETFRAVWIHILGIESNFWPQM